MLEHVSSKGHADAIAYRGGDVDGGAAHPDSVTASIAIGVDPTSNQGAAS